MTDGHWERRMERLERHNRRLGRETARLRRALIGVVALLGGVCALGAAPSAPDVVRAKRFVVVNDDGSRETIELSVDKGVLSLTATDARRGRLYRRGFSLPDVIDAAGVEADLRDGVLTVRLRKREDMKPRRIEIG